MALLLGLTGLFPTAGLDIYGVGCKELADFGCLYVQFTSDVGGSLIILHSVMNNYVIIAKDLSEMA